MLLKTGKSETVALEAEPKFRNEVRREVGKRFQGMVSRKGLCEHWEAGILGLCLVFGTEYVIGIQLIFVEQ